MRYLLLSFLFVLFSYQSQAQKIQVLDQKDNYPLDGVAVFNDDKSKSGITDFDGYVDISIFSTSEIINFKHISHKKKSLKKSEIIAANNTVYLEPLSSALDEVILSVSKFGQNKKDITQSIVTVNSEDIRFRNPQTSADLLESSGQVFVQKSQLGGGSPLIRGFSTNRLLIAVDGVRFNTAIFRGGNVQNVISIDPFTVERTEIILGPGSVVYGSDAIGGVMNFYTKKPSFSFEDGVSFSGDATVRYATANNEKTGHFDFNIGLKEWAFFTSVTYSDFGDLRMGRHGPDEYLRNEFVVTENGVDTVVQNDNPLVQNPTGYNQFNSLQKIRYTPSENWDFSLGLFYTTTSEYDRYDRLIRRNNDGQLRSAEWFFGPQEWFSANLQITNTPSESKWYDKSLITASFQQFKEGRNDRDFQDIILFETDEIVDAYTAGWDLTKKIGKGNLYYGLEYVFNQVDSKGKQTDITTGISSPDVSRYPDGAKWQSAAVYTSFQYPVAKDLSLTGGLRYNRILIDATFDLDLFDLPFSEADINTGALTGSAGLAWQASPILGWKANVSTAFRAPNIDDIGKIFDSEPGSVIVPNPDLEPENATNFEIGATLNFNEVVNFNVTSFYTFLDDALIRNDFSLDGQTEILFQGELSNVQAIQNSAKAEVYGVELGVAITISERVQLTSNYTITEGFEENEVGERNPLRHVAPHFGNTHLTYKKDKWTFDAFSNYNSKFNFEDLAPSQQNNPTIFATDRNGNPFSPSWYTLNLSGEYSFSKALTFNASLQNITDQRYRPYSSGISAPGRNLILAASFSF